MDISGLLTEKRENKSSVFPGSLRSDYNINICQP